MSSKTFRSDRKIIFGAGARVLASYIVLIIFSTLISLVIIRQLLLNYNEKETQRSLNQEVEEFQRLVKGYNPKTGKPFGDDIAALFDVYLKRNVPNDNEFMLTLINGKLYKSSPTDLPESLNPSTAQIESWSQLNNSQWSKKLTSNGETTCYLAAPVKIAGKNLGVFVVLSTDIYERKEVTHTIIVVGVVETVMAIIALTSSVAWLAAGRILTRLRLLTQTAHLISDTDLTQRIPVQGKDEITELTITFNEMLERLQSAFVSQRNFINDAGHELQTPITIVRGHLELLNEEMQIEGGETLELVIDELDRMSRIVNELLLLAKVEQPDFLYLETVDIDLLTEEIYLKASALGNRNWQLDGKASGKIIVDRHRIAQAALTLAQNATQHTKTGEEIAIGSALIKGNIHFWVRDAGEGVALGDQKKIFQRFARGSNSRRRSEGAGLGLAIAKTIAQAHGGSIKLVSEIGCGATFTIIFPVKTPQGNIL